MELESQEEPNRLLLMIKGILGGIVQIVVFAGLLLIPAYLLPEGTVFWKEAIIFLMLYSIVLITSIAILSVKSPKSIEARLKPPISRDEQPVRDQILTLLLIVLCLAWFVFIPIDVFYLKLSPSPSYHLAIVGLGGAMSGLLLVVRTIYVNAFAIPYVEDQSHKGQVIIETGPYAIVRHPMYLGILIFQLGLALWLGSIPALILVLVSFTPFIWRIKIEERVLIKSQPRYLAYIKKTKYRLIPLIW